jgi:hypothetical protein
VLDLGWNRLNQAILDTSATCHMPDVIEMPYRPMITRRRRARRAPHTYRLGGQTCLAGDVIGDYSFPEPLEVGQRLVFEDMALLHDGEDHHVQRHQPALDRDLELQYGPTRDCARVWLCRFQGTPVLNPRSLWPGATPPKKQ